MLATLGLFFFASLLEIGGGYLVWKWLRDRRGKVFGLIGALVLFSYGIVPTFQPANFGRVYAAYGGIFIASSILWGYWVDRKKPDKYEVLGSLVVLVGVAVMFYFPR